MRKLLFCIAIFWGAAKPFEGLGQSKGLVDSINKVIGPRFSYSGYIYTINVSGGKQFVLMGAYFRDDGRDFKKVFVLKKQQHKLVIFDSSAAFECLSHCSMRVEGDLLIVGEGFSHGDYCELTYKLNPISKKFTLVKLQNREVIYTYKQDSVHEDVGNQRYSIEYLETYDVLKETLTLESSKADAETDSILGQNDKIIKRKVPGLKTSLKGMKEPQDYSEVFSDGDDKIE